MAGSDRPAECRRTGISLQVGHGLDERHACAIAISIRSSDRIRTVTVWSPSAASTRTRSNSSLPLSHDEVVHGKRSLLGKQWGDGRRQFAGLRTLFGYMWSVPGKKLLFMGGEFGQWTEWNHDAELDWVLLDYAPHQEVLSWVRTLNALHRTEPALHQADHEPEGFQWVEADDYARAVFAYLRMAPDSRPGPGVAQLHAGALGELPGWRPATGRLGGPGLERRP